jgi:hypothetical protein
MIAAYLEKITPKIIQQYNLIYSNTSRPETLITVDNPSFTNAIFNILAKIMNNPDIPFAIETNYGNPPEKPPYFVIYGMEPSEYKTIQKRRQAIVSSLTSGNIDFVTCQGFLEEI